MKHLEQYIGRATFNGEDEIASLPQVAIAAAQVRIDSDSPRVYVRVRPIEELKRWAEAGTAGLASGALNAILSVGHSIIADPFERVVKRINGFPMEVYPNKWRLEPGLVLALPWKKANWLLAGPLGPIMEEVDDEEGAEIIRKSKQASTPAKGK